MADTASPDTGSSDTVRSIAVCIAAFNRRETTLNCLRHLQASELQAGESLHVYLLDDASTDGTADAVRREFPDVHVFSSPGDLWWAGGMRVAFGEALKSRHDFYIWMNDDVTPRANAVRILVDTSLELTARLGGHHLVSGAMIDPESGRYSYGAFRLKRQWLPKPFSLILPDPTEPLACDLVNANMLLIPGPIAHAIGNIPDIYVHTLGDWDYGLTARKAGAGLWLAPGSVGTCKANVPNRMRWGGDGLSLWQRYRKMQHPLAAPFGSRAGFMLRHFPWVAAFFIPGPYLKLPIDHLRWQMRARRR